MNGDVLSIFLWALCLLHIYSCSGSFIRYLNSVFTYVLNIFPDYHLAFFSSPCLRYLVSYKSMLVFSHIYLCFSFVLFGFGVVFNP